MKKKNPKDSEKPHRHTQTTSTANHREPEKLKSLRLTCFID